MQRHGLHRTQTPLRHNTQIPPRHPCLKTGAFRNARSVKDEPWLPKLNPAAAARYDALVTCCASSNGPTHLPGIHHDDPQPKTRRPSLRPPSMRRAPSPLLSINIYLYRSRARARERWSHAMYATAHFATREREQRWIYQNSFLGQTVSWTNSLILKGTCRPTSPRVGQAAPR